MQDFHISNAIEHTSNLSQNTLENSIDLMIVQSIEKQSNNYIWLNSIDLAANRTSIVFNWLPLVYFFEFALLPRSRLKWALSANGVRPVSKTLGSCHPTDHKIVPQNCSQRVSMSFFTFCRNRCILPCLF